MLASDAKKQPIVPLAALLPSAIVSSAIVVINQQSLNTHSEKTRAVDMKSGALSSVVQMAFGVKSNNGAWIVTKGTPYGKESSERSIGGDCHQKPLFLQITYLR